MKFGYYKNLIQEHWRSFERTRCCRGRRRSVSFELLDICRRCLAAKVVLRRRYLRRSYRRYRNLLRSHLVRADGPRRPNLLPPSPATTRGCPAPCLLQNASPSPLLQFQFCDFYRQFPASIHRLIQRRVPSRDFRLLHKQTKVRSDTLPLVSVENYRRVVVRIRTYLCLYPGRLEKHEKRYTRHVDGLRSLQYSKCIPGKRRIVLHMSFRSYKWLRISPG